MTFRNRTSAARIERIVELLAERPRHTHELAVALPLSKRNVTVYLNHLHGQGRVHITRWVRDIDERDRMYPRPVYALGAGNDAPKPKPLNAHQRNARAWKRIKVDPERYVDHLLSKRKYRADQRGPRCDIAASWITGVTA